MPMNPVPSNLLTPDLDVIRAFADAKDHAVPEEARVASALYEDVCWRLAALALPSSVAAELERLELEAAGLLVSYLGGEREAVAFWSAFGSCVARMSELVSTVADRRASPHHQELARLRARVVAANLSPVVRSAVQPRLAELERAERALAADPGQAAAFAKAFQEGAAAIEDALAQAATLPDDSPEARAHRRAADVLAAPPPPFLRQALLARLEALARAWEVRRPVAPGELAGLEALLERAADFAATHVEAARRHETLRAWRQKSRLPEAAAADADRALAELATLLDGLEAGRLEADDFQTAFDQVATRLDALRAAPVADVSRQEAWRQLDAARVRAEDVALPRFVAKAAHGIVGRLEHLLAAEPQPGAAPVAPAFRTWLAALDHALALGTALAGERTWARGRLDAWRRAADAASLPNLLRGPVDDELWALRELLDQLEAGHVPPAEFHAAFERGDARLAALLGWSAGEAGRRAGT